MQNNMKYMQFISIEVLKSHGYSLYKINQLVKSGKLERINRSYYENLEYNGEINDFYTVPAYSQNKGVICLISAASYYGLTTEKQVSIDVAIPRESRIPEYINWVGMEFYRFSKQRYETGIRKIEVGENYFYIYDIEKTVCDIIFYRNKLGFEPAIEILRNYLSMKNRNINKLMKYAKLLRIESFMKQILGVMI